MVLKVLATEKFNPFLKVFSGFTELLNPQVQESEPVSSKQVFLDSLTLSHGQQMGKGNLKK